jgi:hypothetical protein
MEANRPWKISQILVQTNASQAGLALESSRYAIWETPHEARPFVIG